ncbi:hypothetical protein GF326_08135 [Candidatus Bathyarchaeota archaeon]|nr:hypothetical protein [Candidatus Bathyarchaeota archaeon]
MKHKTKLRTLLGALMIFSMMMNQVYAVPDEFQLPSASWTPEHPLYGFERFLEERIEVPLSRIRGGKEGEAEKRLQLAEERLAEMEQVANGTRVEDLEEFKGQLDALDDEIEELDEPQSESEHCREDRDDDSQELPEDDDEDSTD